MRPDRWRAVVAEVPFVDCVTTMLDASIPLTVNEWDEWGDPRDPDDYALPDAPTRPYDNPPSGPAAGAARDRGGPRSAGGDPRAGQVGREAARDGYRGLTLLFRAELGVGAHGGPSGRSARLRYEAEIQAFVLDAMGITA